MIQVRAIAATQPLVPEIPDSEGIISYCARVSNSSNQTNWQTAEGLLQYCIKHSHWSVFETVNVLMEIEAPRDISRQILRHRTATFQEFSQRYADVTDEMFCTRELRMQDDKNRQNSIELPFGQDNPWHEEWEDDQKEVLALVQAKQKKWRERNAAKESVRVFMPEGLTMSKMYMNATVRTWLHYVDLRGGNGTQKEHIEVAVKCREALAQLLPTLFKENVNG